MLHGAHDKLKSMVTCTIRDTQEHDHRALGNSGRCDIPLYSGTHVSSVTSRIRGLCRVEVEDGLGQLLLVNVRLVQQLLLASDIPTRVRLSVDRHSQQRIK